nr:hypothetical protein [Arthrobacter sp. AQ5-05]
MLPKKRYLVRTMGLTDVQKTLDLRILLEPHAPAARRPGGALCRRPAGRHECVPRLPPSHLGCIAQFTPGRFLAALLRRDRPRPPPASRAAALHGRPTELAEHEAIHAALAAADARAAEEAMRVHLRSIRNAMAQQFTDPGSLEA